MTAHRQTPPLTSSACCSAMPTSKKRSGNRLRRTRLSPVGCRHRGGDRDDVVDAWPSPLRSSSSEKTLTSNPAQRPTWIKLAGLGVDGVDRVECICSASSDPPQVRSPCPCVVRRRARSPGALNPRAWRRNACLERRVHRGRRWVPRTSVRGQSNITCGWSRASLMPTSWHAVQRTGSNGSRRSSGTSAAAAACGRSSRRLLVSRACSRRPARWVGETADRGGVATGRCH